MPDAQLALYVALVKKAQGAGNGRNSSAFDVSTLMRQNKVEGRSLLHRQS